MNRPPRLVSIVGKKKSGKTTVLVNLAAELTVRGWRVATIKHSHGFTMDHEGRDSWRHRNEGHAIRTVIASDDEFAVLGSWPTPEPLDAKELARRFLYDADVVLVEGYRTEALPTIEVYQRVRHHSLWYQESGGEHYLAIASDDPAVQAVCPVFDLNAAALSEALADVIEAKILHACVSEV